MPRNYYRISKGIAKDNGRMYNLNMKKKLDDILEKYSGFEPVHLAHGRRDSKAKKAEDIQSFAMSIKGRLTVPSAIWKHYKKLRGEYFIFRFNQKTREVLLVITTTQGHETKTIAGLDTPTRYFEIGPQLLAFKIDPKHISEVPFKIKEEEGVILLNFAKAIPRKATSRK